MRFHCDTNPNFSLTNSRVSIRFSNGYYETEDKEEIRLLKRDGHAVEVPDQPEPEYEVAPPLQDADFDPVEPRDGEPGSTITTIP